MRLSLKGRIALIIMTGAVLTVVAVLLTVYHSLVDDLEQLHRQRQAEETVRAAEQVEQVLALRLNALESFSAQLSNGLNLDPMSQLLTKMERQRHLRRFFPDGLMVFDSNGTAIAESTLVPGRVGTNYADRPHFKRLFTTRKPVISHPIIGRTTGAPLVSFLSPILSDDGDLLGILGGVINLAQTSILPKRRLADALREGVTFRILDTDNLVYVYNGADLSSELQPLPAPGESPLIDAALSGFNIGITQDENRQQMVFATTHLEQLRWVFVRAVPYDQVIAPARAFFLRFAGISVLIGGGLALLAFWLAWTAMRPLEFMTRQIRRMATQAANNQQLPETGVTEVAELARAFNQLTAERKALSEVKDDFVAVVSHELRTPLTSINGALKLMQSGAVGALPEKADNLTLLALRNGERLQTIINDLLDFNKLNAGKLELAPKPCCIMTLVKEAIAGNRPMADDYRVTLCSATAPVPSAYLDPLRLRQVLDNLISNAIKFSPPGGTVTVRVEWHLPDWLRITVSDQGEGIPEAFGGRLFERFAQAEHGTMRASRGTGLGLAICKELVELMEGRIGFYNRDGAHLWVELPGAVSSDSTEHRIIEDMSDDHPICTDR
ncbi:ATP-binding protein [uncultured Oceanisphaera sp.]|uniref:sensor histidine kinase n=1 Tax=uncultured Oceanisphaera sp. TaxID=353858 RepID=UPI002638C5CB|nr:ATP-binding protein [uncultured Oceanisphaera sp.]